MIQSQRFNDSEPQVPPETEFLVTDMETHVNENIDEYLDGYPSIIKATDYKVLLGPDGKLPIGIRRLDNAYVSPTIKNVHEFIGVDILMQFPVQYGAENPINITFKWSGDVQCRIAIVDKRPLVLIEKGDAVLDSAFIDMDEMATYLNSCGLPKSIWGTDLDQVIEDIDSSSDTHIYQRTEVAVDPYTNMEIVHERRYKTDAHESMKILDELCLNIDHLEENAFALTDDIYLGPEPTYRNMLRFERDGDDEGEELTPARMWKYRGAYSGKLESGEFVDEFVQIDPKLVIPNTKVVAKALSVVSQKPY